MTPESLFGRLKVPAMAAPMFLVSGPDLVVETCRGGILGTFPTLNQRTPEGYEAWLIEIRNRLSGVDAAPFGVQMGIHHTNPRMAVDLELSIKHQVPVLVTTLGITREITDAVHSYGGLVFHDATTVKHAVKALDANVDGIIAVCAGAGGHSGTYNPFAFISELRPLIGDKTLILAGSIGTGQAMAGAMAGGADMVSIGTRFIATHESMCSDEQKRMILDSTVQDIVFTEEVSGIGASILRQTLSRPFDAPAQIGRFDVGKEISPKLWKNIWSAGQGVGAVKDVVSTAELCLRLRDEYRAALERVSGLIAA